MQKEFTGFGKEEGEPRGIHLARIERRIREIGIVGQGPSQGRRNTVKRVAAPGEAYAGIFAGYVPVALDTANAVKLNVQAETLVKPFEAALSPSLRDVMRREIGIDRRPVNLLAPALNNAPEVKAPIRLPLLIGKTLNRNRDLNDPTIVDYRGTRFPNGIPLA